MIDWNVWFTCFLCWKCDRIKIWFDIRIRIVFRQLYYFLFKFKIVSFGFLISIRLKNKTLWRMQGKLSIIIIICFIIVFHINFQIFSIRILFRNLARHIPHYYYCVLFFHIIIGWILQEPVFSHSTYSSMGSIEIFPDSYSPSFYWEILST